MIWEEIGRRIKNLRCDKNLTQAKFAELVGLSMQHVEQVEKGKPLSVEQILAICKKTNVTMDYVVCGNVDPLANLDFLNDLSADQINISLDILKRVADLVKSKNGNNLLIKELMRSQTLSA